MPLNVARTRHYLKQFEVGKLFIEELGWDRHSAVLTVYVGDRNYVLRSVAEKRGVQILVCAPDDACIIPDYDTRRKIEKQVAKSVFEHLIIFIDQGKTIQVWQWVLRRTGQPAAYREHHYHATHHSGDALIQKLESINFPLSAEEGLTLTGVTFSLRDAFDRDRLTKRFYDHFKKEHGAFLEFITGIKEVADSEWYASLMLNRLMFIYFIQQKGFLDNDQCYLRNRLRLVQGTRGKGKFHTFYRRFLLRLFHEGFAQQKSHRSSDLDELLGNIPYLNGGLFEVHELEQNYPDIDIPDEAFEQVFTFFDQWSWHLDERPLHNDREINPDVLGYIFEKYINQKQMGAYYTKEDITGYIGKYTIIPFLFDAAKKKCAIAFAPEASLWKILAEDLDRYIYEPVRRGVIDDQGEIIPESVLPEFVREGMHNPKARMFDRKYNLGEADLCDAADKKLTLPTETWREYVQRRQRCLEIREKLAKGEVQSINDLITLNLDIRQFAEDAIAGCEGPELLRAFFQTISSMTVLDPTCGSGAFLFAALMILEPLYEACLVRMQAFVEDLDRSDEHHSPRKFEDFRKVLSEVDRHPSPRYFILKSIIVNNLYGVDIMEEAVEICKLRLFLKLVSQVDKVSELEPLPDIDFNIRSGNTLVGYTSLEEIRHAAGGDVPKQASLIFPEEEDTIGHIEEEARECERAFERFHEMQTEYKMDDAEFASGKKELRDRLKNLDDELDRYLAVEYEIDPNKKRTYTKWRQSHQPFHWFTEFYGIMRRGGFDVIVGNPPWVESAKVQKDYIPKGLITLKCNNLWAYVVERSYSILSKQGFIGLILPMSLVCTERMIPIQNILKKTGLLWLANFESDSNPGQLFDGVKQNVTILIGRKSTNLKTWTTKLYRFFQDYRSLVFFNIEFVSLNENPFPFGFPKVSTEKELSVLDKMFLKPNLASQMAQIAINPVLVHRIAHYYIKCFDFVPYFKSDRDGLKKSEDYKEYIFNSPIEQFVAAINSTTFYFYWQVFFDAFKAGKLCVESFPFGNAKITGTINELNKLALELMNDLKNKSTRLIAEYVTTGHVEYDQFYPRNSKSIIDQIDIVLSKHYDFTSEELDLIINYDIKYRMGQDVEGDTEE